MACAVMGLCARAAGRCSFIMNLAFIVTAGFAMRAIVNTYGEAVMSAGNAADVTYATFLSAGCPRCALLSPAVRDTSTWLCDIPGTFDQNSLQFWLWWTFMPSIPGIRCALMALEEHQLTAIAFIIIMGITVIYDIGVYAVIALEINKNTCKEGFTVAFRYSEMYVIWWLLCLVYFWMYSVLHGAYRFDPCSPIMFTVLSRGQVVWRMWIIAKSLVERWERLEVERWERGTVGSSAVRPREVITRSCDAALAVEYAGGAAWVGSSLTSFPSVHEYAARLLDDMLLFIVEGGCGVITLGVACNAPTGSSEYNKRIDKDRTAKLYLKHGLALTGDFGHRHFWRDYHTHGHYHTDVFRYYAYPPRSGADTADAPQRGKRLRYSPRHGVDQNGGSDWDKTYGSVETCTFWKHAWWSPSGTYINWRFGPIWESNSILAVGVDLSTEGEPCPVIGQRVFPSLQALQDAWQSLLDLRRLSCLPAFVKKYGGDSCDSFLSGYWLDPGALNILIERVSEDYGPCQDSGWELSEANMRKYDAQFPEFRASPSQASESSRSTYVDREDVSKGYANSLLETYHPRNTTSTSEALIIDGRKMGTSTSLIKSGLWSPRRLRIVNNSQDDSWAIQEALREERRQQRPHPILHRMSSFEFLADARWRKHVFSLVVLDYMSATYWPRDLRLLLPNRVSLGGLVAITCPARTPRTRKGRVSHSEDRHMNAESRNMMIVPEVFPQFGPGNDQTCNVDANVGDYFVVGKNSCRGFVVKFTFTFSGLFKVMIEMMQARFWLNEAFIYKAEGKSTFLWHASFGDCRDRLDMFQHGIPNCVCEQGHTSSIKDELYIYLFMRSVKKKSQDRSQTVSCSDLKILKASDRYPLLARAADSFLKVVEQFADQSGQQWDAF